MGQCRSEGTAHSRRPDATRWSRAAIVETVQVAVRVTGRAEYDNAGRDQTEPE